MKKRTPRSTVTSSTKSTSIISTLYPAVIAGVCGLICAFSGVYWQAKSGAEHRIYENRVAAYEKFASDYNDTQIKSLIKMQALIAASQRVSTDWDIAQIETEWSDFFHSSDGVDANQKLRSAITPALLHGSDRTILIGRAIIATLSHDSPLNSLRKVGQKIAENFLHAIDPNTSCYGCNLNSEPEISAKLLALSSLLVLLENSIVCDLNSRSKLC